MEGGVVDFVLGLGMLEVEQVDKAVTPQHLVRQIRGSSLEKGLIQFLFQPIVYNAAFHFQGLSLSFGILAIKLSK